MKIAVLGCGPAGLMAVHAAALTGHDVHIYSKKRKSEMFGAQYLHAPIPGMTDTAPVTVTYELRGTHDEYREKVYGDLAGQVPSVSTEDLGETHDAWDIRRTYDNLWDTYAEFIQDVAVDPLWLKECVESGDYDVVFSTLPAPSVCATLVDGPDIPDTSPHVFRAQEIWAIGDAPERGTFAPFAVRKDAIICNGEPSPSWYRAANVFSRTTVEWPIRTKPPIANVSRVPKPISTNCSCHPAVVRLGRYGKWSKGVLAHHAFQDVMDRLTTASV